MNSTKPMKVLLVEDNDKFRQTLKRLVESYFGDQGIELKVEPYETAAKALDLLRSAEGDTFSMLVTDLRFPPEDDPSARPEDYPRTGLDVIRVAHGRVPLIVGYTTTGLPQWGSDDKDARDVGVDRFYHKAHLTSDYKSSPFPEIIDLFKARLLGGAVAPSGAEDPSISSCARGPARGETVFIGHGRSPLWRELKDFVHEEFGLPYEEFDRVSNVGRGQIVRLSAMLESAAVALLVLTGEDERADGQLQARQNVVHELGLFQGRLGFDRAVILREEACAEFSNMAGVTEIRFPPGLIKATFDDVRRFLVREGVAPPSP